MHGRRRCTRRPWPCAGSWETKGASPPRSTTWGSWRTSKATTGGQGDLGRATALYAQSLTLCREIGNKSGAVYCLEGLAAVVCAQGQPECAARLWGTAEATRSLIGAPLAPNERPRYERLVAAV